MLNNQKSSGNTNIKNICILGSTGSIGKSTLDVISRHPDKYNVQSLAANSSVDAIFEQCLKFLPKQVVLVSEAAAQELVKKLKLSNKAGIEVLSGVSALSEIVVAPEVDTVMAAIVGASGLLPTLEAIKAGKRVLLANKEALVTSGQIFIDAVKESGAELLPIDSEHNAIFQCLPHKFQSSSIDSRINEHGISKILLTGSGGPFRSRNIDTFEDITPEEACAHPNWDMGRKISVDSATMMNKGLEFIEAKWLFNLKPVDIQVVLHPQSTIHSMVQYIDGSVIAQMGNPDMRTPIAHALAFPERVESGVEPLDFFNAKSFEFQNVDFNRYPNLKLAIDACKIGQGACTSLNASNEVAVEAFLSNKIKFTEIFKINETSVYKFVSEEVNNIEDVITLDQKVRTFAQSLINEKTKNSRVEIN